MKWMVGNNHNLSIKHNPHRCEGGDCVTSHNQKQPISREVTRKDTEMKVGRFLDVAEDQQASPTPQIVHAPATRQLQGKPNTWAGGVQHHRKISGHQTVPIKVPENPVGPPLVPGPSPAARSPAPRRSGEHLLG